MKRLIIIFTLFVLTFFVFITIETAHAGTKKDLKYGLKQEKTTVGPIKSGKSVLNKSINKSLHKANKIQSFLDVINNAKKLDEIRNAFEKANFTEIEMRQLEQEARKGRYKAKMDNLIQKSGKQITKNNTGKSKGKRADLSQLKLKLKQARSQKLSRVNQEAERHLSTVRGAPDNRVVTNVEQPASNFTPSYNAVHVNPPSSGVASPVSPVNIMRFSPDNAIIGQNMTIHGSGFGSSRGEVRFYLGEQGNREGPFSVSIQSWSSTAITVAIPLEWENYLVWEGDGHSPLRGVKPGSIYIKNVDVDMGGWERVTVSLDPQRFLPVIESLTGEGSITPGQILIIQGEHFKIDEIIPEVKLYVGSEAIELIIDDYDNTFIQARLPDNIEGLHEQLGRIKVITQISESNFKTVTFIPVLEYRDIESEKMEIVCHACRPFGSKPWRYWLCLQKQTTKHTLHDWVLQNGWVVADSWMEIKSRGNNSGGKYLTKPENDSTLAASRIKIWAGAFSKTTCREYLRLKGPKGTFDSSH